MPLGYLGIDLFSYEGIRTMTAKQNYWDTEKLYLTVQFNSTEHMRGNQRKVKSK